MAVVSTVYTRAARPSRIFTVMPSFFVTVTWRSAASDNTWFVCDGRDTVMRCVGRVREDVVVSRRP